MHFFKGLKFTRGGTPYAIVVKVEYLRRVQSNRLYSSREGDTSYGVSMVNSLLTTSTTCYSLTRTLWQRSERELFWYYC